MPGNEEVDLLTLLLLLFVQAGPLKCVKIPKTLQGESRPFGFIEYQHECSVDYAIQLFHRTTLFGQELQLKPRQKRDVGRPGPGQNFEMHRAHSLPVLMKTPFQSPMQFFRPPLVPGNMIPHMNSMLNCGMPMPPVMPQHIRFNEEGSPRIDPIFMSALANGMPMPPVTLPHHIHFKEEGSPISQSIPIPSVANGRYQARAATSYQETNNKRRYNNQDGNSTTQNYQPEEKKTRYSHSDKHEGYDRTSLNRNEHRQSSSYHEDGYRDSSRRDSRLSRRDNMDVYQEDRRHRGNDHRHSRSYEDDHQESRSHHHRGKSYNRDRPNNPRHYHDK